MVGIRHPERQTFRSGIIPEIHAGWGGYTGRNAGDETGPHARGPHEGPSCPSVLELVL